MLSAQPGRRQRPTAALRWERELRPRSLPPGTGICSNQAEFICHGRDGRLGSVTVRNHRRSGLAT